MTSRTNSQSSGATYLPKGEGRVLVYGALLGALAGVQAVRLPQVAHQS